MDNSVEQGLITGDPIARDPTSDNPTSGNPTAEELLRGLEPRSQSRLGRYNAKRKSMQHVFMLVTALLLSAASAGYTACQQWWLMRTVESYVSSRGVLLAPHEVIEDAVASTFYVSIVLALGIVAALGMALAVIVLAAPRLVAAEFWLRRLGAGDLDHTVEATGNDELTQALLDLETLRQRSILSSRVDLVSRLSVELQDRNGQLEQALLDLRLAQDMLVSQQKLRELHDLTSAIAHELRNPLNMVSNFAGVSAVLVNDISEYSRRFGFPDEDAGSAFREDLGDLRSNLERVVFNSCRASEIIGQMLALGAESGAKRRSVDLNYLVLECVRMTTETQRPDPETAEPGIAELMVDYELSPEVGKVGLVFEDMVLAVRSVVSNACYAVNERAGSAQNNGYHPHLLVSSELSGSGEAVLRFRDNGTGMPEDVVARIFNPFFTTKPANRGAGLGLTLAYDVVREHGGVITAVSEPGSYTEVEIRLPAGGAPDGGD